MITPIFGILILICVMAVALTERAGMKLGFFDYHAAIVVFGGVGGSLCIAIDSRSLRRMLQSLRELLPGATRFQREMRQTQLGIVSMRSAWREGRRAEILEMADKGETEELRVGADALLKQLNGQTLSEKFTIVRTSYVHRFSPLIEGWDMVAKLAPSFGMVGTVTGMVQLFRNMGENSGNLGGAMAMALLATLYGISLGATVGGPMASRVNKQFNDRMALLELLERTVAALVEESSKYQPGGAKDS